MFIFTTFCDCDMIMLASKNTSTSIDVHGYAVVDHDSLYSSFNIIQSSLSQQGKSIESLSEKLNDIYDYGIGYHDSTSIIFIPLIIALFAFTMPLLFQVITHVNSKYSSQSITEMFKHSRTYRLFWLISKISISYMFLFGLLSLSLNGGLFNKAMSIANWISLFVAVAYATITLSFIKTCINFNSPQKLLSIIGQQYRDDLQFDNIKITVQKIKHLKDKALFWKSKGWKSFKEYQYRSFRWVGYYKSNVEYGDRITDLCKYAMSIRNNSLFLSVLLEIEKIAKREKKDRYISPVFSYSEFNNKSHLPLIHEFFKGAFNYYMHSDVNAYYEESLLRYWLKSFNHSKFPFEKDIVEIVRTIVTAVETGYIGVYEKYIKDAGFNYLYIQDLQTIAFIEGAGNDDQIKIDGERREVWERICDLHFLMNAYLISRGYYQILKPLLSANYYLQGHIYPLTPHEILAAYANLRDKVHEGGYKYWGFKEMFGRETPDKDMMETFTVVMMMLTSPLYDTMRGLAPEDCIKNIKECKALLSKCADRVKENKSLLDLYPEIKEVDFAELYNSCEETFDFGHLLDDYEKNSDDTIGCWTSLYGKIESFVSSIGLIKKSTKNLPSVFDVSIPSDKKELFDYDILSVFRNTGWIPKGLKERPDKGNIDTIELQELGMMMSKRYLYNYNHENSLDLQRHIEIVFEKRAVYMSFAAISRMNIKRKKVRVGDFEKYFNSYTNGMNEDYVIIDANCELSIMLDKKTTNNPFVSQYLGAEYKYLYLDSSEYFKDLTLLELFGNSLLILRKEDFPSLVYKNNGVRPELSMKDMSDKAKGFAAMWVTIKPNMIMKFYKNTKIVMVELKR